MASWMNRIKWMICCLCCIAWCAKADRITYSLNTDWAFYRGDYLNGEQVGIDDSQWIPISIPHIMQLEKKHCGGDIIYDGIGWYRRYFKMPYGCEDKRILLQFEGVMNSCEVYLNGKKIVEHKGGYVGFSVDVSPYIERHSANNVLAIRVSAEYDSLTPPGKPQDRLDFYYYSGIYRDVKMVVTDKLYITDELEENNVAGGGLFVTYPEVNAKQATVRLKTHVRNTFQEARTVCLLSSVRDTSGQVVAQKEMKLTLKDGEARLVLQDIEIKSPQLWHPYHPNLYQLECELCDEEGLVLDRRVEQIGIRTISYSTEKGFFINGEHLYLVGANRHQSFPHVGDTASNSMQERDVIDMKRGGYNAVRAAHYPHDPAFLSACDKYGLLVIECIPGWQYFNEEPVFANRLEEVCRTMIRRDRNHPSIVLWETALNETTYPLQVVERIYRAAHEEYPGDQMYTSADYFSHEETEPFYDVFYKQVGHFPKDGSVMTNERDNLISVKPLFTREWGDGVGEKPRVSLQENEYEQMRQCRSRLRQLNGDGYFDWCMLDANPRMGGHFMWSYNDYARGAEEVTMYSGVVDVNRYPKFGYYMMQSMRPASVSQAGLYEGPMVFIASFNSGQYPSATSEIMVFSNCDEVHLYRNGKLLGKQTRKERASVYPWIVQKGGSPSFVFDAGSYEPGALRAEAWLDGQLVKTHEVCTPGEPDHLSIEILDPQVQPVADGSDMIPIYVKVCDKQGTVVPTSAAEITLEVSGEGHLIGDGIRRIGVNPQKVEAGIGYALIHTTQKAGQINIKAVSEGLKPAELSCHTIHCEMHILPDGNHAPFTGDEEQGVVVKDTKWDKEILSHETIVIDSIWGDVGSKEYPLRHTVDGDDFSWWISEADSFPQTVTFVLPHITKVYGSRIRFQKDSSSYQHRVEISEDGQTWETLYEKECTGWDFKPVRFQKHLRYFRIVFEKVSEGHPALAEVTLFK